MEIKNKKLYLDGEMSYCVAVGTAYNTSAYKCNKSNVSWRHNCSAQLSIYSNKMQDLHKIKMKMKMKMSLVFFFIIYFCLFFSRSVFDCILQTVMWTKWETNQRLHTAHWKISKNIYIEIQPDEKWTHQRGNNRQYRWARWFLFISLFLHLILSTPFQCFLFLYS